MTSFQMTYGIASEIGYLRKANCDTVAAQTWSNNIGLFIVADGIGPEGQQSSQFACEIVVTELGKYFESASNTSTNASDKPFSVLKAAIQKANLEILKTTPESGTTFTAALVVSNSLYIAHVGDSRAYLISNRDTQQVTNDHTFTYELIKRGYVTAEQLKTHAVDDVLYRALGQNEAFEIETHLLNILPNSWLLLSTNGLVKWSWGIISEEEVYLTLSQNEPQLATDILVGLAKARESYNDISAVIIKFDAV